MYDVDAQELVEKAAEELKKQKLVTLPLLISLSY